MKHRKWDIDSVSKYIDEKFNGEIKLLSNEYKTMRTKLDIQCKCGNIFQSTLSSLVRSERGLCKKCTSKIVAENRKYNINDVISFINSNGCKYISGEYNGIHSDLEIQCKCGDIFTTNFDAFKSQNKRTCNKCGKMIQISKTKNDFNDIIDEIESYNCKCISDHYKNAYSKLDIECACGNIMHKTIMSFRRSPRCSECSKKKWLISRKKYISEWDENISVKKLIRNKLKGWIFDITQLYSNKCPITGNTENLVVHHLYALSNIVRDTIIEVCGYNVDIPDDKILNIPSQEILDEIIDIGLSKHTKNIGILISKDVHIKFHQEYGKGYNTPEQFDEFLWQFYHLHLSDIQVASNTK